MDGILDTPGDDQQGPDTTEQTAAAAQPEHVETARQIVYIQADRTGETPKYQVTGIGGTRLMTDKVAAEMNAAHNNAAFHITQYLEVDKYNVGDSIEL